MNAVVLLLTQNIFQKNAKFRDVSLNATYVVIFKNPRDKTQISSFSRQFSPGNSKYIVKAYEALTAKPHTYLLFDSHQQTDDQIRIRTNILNTTEPITVVSADEHVAI